MPNTATKTSYLDLLRNALVLRRTAGPDHAKDPPEPHVLPLGDAAPEAQKAIALLLGADHDIRDDHDRAAGINLALAETRLRLAISHGDATPALGIALERIEAARQELAKHDSRRACAALADAIRAVTAPA